MKILIQKSTDRDVVGVSNALVNTHEVTIWDPEENIRDIGDVDLAIFSDSLSTGYKTYSALKKGTKVLFLKCEQPGFFKGDGTVISNLPYCSDDKRYPPDFPEKRYYCDVIAFNPMGNLNNYIDILEGVPKNLTFRIVGEPVNSPHFIGGCISPQQVSKYCLSAGVCLDFGLETGLDLAKIGCNVITDTENTIDIPSFTTEISTSNNTSPVTLATCIENELKKKPPVLNPYDIKIITYTQFIQYMIDTVDNKMNTYKTEVQLG